MAELDQESLKANPLAAFAAAEIAFTAWAEGRQVQAQGICDEFENERGSSEHS